MTRKFGQVRKALTASGWVKIRQEGSHEVYLHASRSGIVVVAGKNSETVPPGTLSNILKQSGLTREDL